MITINSPRNWPFFVFLVILLMTLLMIIKRHSSEAYWQQPIDDHSEIIHKV